MSLVWSLIASFLYVEIVIVLMLVLPVASPQRWQRFFKSRFLAMLSRQAQTYFYLLLFVLVLFLLEAIREMRKYSHVGEFHGTGGSYYVCSLEFDGEISSTSTSVFNIHGIDFYY